jgi:hypothetical protein
MFKYQVALASKKGRKTFHIIEARNINHAIVKASREFGRENLSSVRRIMKSKRDTEAYYF